MKNRLLLVLLTGALLGCRPTIDVQGMYVGEHQDGALFPCDDPTVLLRVPDTALVARYRLIEGDARDPVYVHLRGIKRRSGGVYGGPRYFVVREILEIRARRAGECPNVAQPIAPLFSSSRLNTPTKEAGHGTQSP